MAGDGGQDNSGQVESGQQSDTQNEPAADSPFEESLIGDRDTSAGDTKGEPSGAESFSGGVFDRTAPDNKATPDISDEAVDIKSESVRDAAKAEALRTGDVILGGDTKVAVSQFMNELPRDTARSISEGETTLVFHATDEKAAHATAQALAESNSTGVVILEGGSESQTADEQVSQTTAGLESIHQSLSTANDAFRAEASVLLVSSDVATALTGLIQGMTEQTRNLLSQDRLSLSVATGSPATRDTCVQVLSHNGIAGDISDEVSLSAPDRESEIVMARLEKQLPIEVDELAEQFLDAGKTVDLHVSAKPTDLKSALESAVQSLPPAVVDGLGRRYTIQADFNYDRDGDAVLHAMNEVFPGRWTIDDDARPFSEGDTGATIVVHIKDRQAD